MYIILRCKKKKQKTMKMIIYNVFIINVSILLNLLIMEYKI